MQSPFNENSNQTMSFNDGLDWMRNKVFFPYQNHGKLRGKLFGEFFSIHEKDEGTEPGFIAISTNEHFWQILNKDLLAREGKNCIQFFNSSSFQIWLDTASTLEEKDFENFAVKIYEEHIKSKNSNSPLTPYLFKQVYDEPDPVFNRVGPAASQLKNSKTIKNLPEFAQSPAARVYAWARSDSSQKCNFNAICESLAMAITSAHGMLTQELYLAKSEYENGDEKILLATAWEKKLRSIGNSLAGSKNPSDYQNYLISKDQQGRRIRNKQGQYFSSHLNGLSEFFPLIIALGDRDAIGSEGQNKGEVDGKLFCYDFGKCLQGSSILESLDCYFQFDQPFNPLERFKNFSVFTDASLIEHLVGVLYLYKLIGQGMIEGTVFTATEIEKVNHIFSLYEKNPAFRLRATKVFPGALNIIFNNYVAIFKNFETRINEKRELIIDSIRKILCIFKPFLMVEPEIISILDGLRRLTLKTSETSEDGMVILNHLRILPRAVQEMAWEMDQGKNFIFFETAGKESVLKKSQEIIIHFFKNFNIEQYLLINIVAGKLQLAIKIEGLTFCADKFTSANIIEFKRKLVEPCDEVNLQAKFEENYELLTKSMYEKTPAEKEKFVFYIISWLQSAIQLKEILDKNKAPESILSKSMNGGLTMFGAKATVFDKDKEDAVKLLYELEMEISCRNNVDEELVLIFGKTKAIADQVNQANDISAFRNYAREICKKAFALIPEEKRVNLNFGPGKN